MLWAVRCATASTLQFTAIGGGVLKSLRCKHLRRKTPYCEYCDIRFNTLAKSLRGKHLKFFKILYFPFEGVGGHLEGGHFPIINDSPKNGKIGRVAATKYRPSD